MNVLIWSIAVFSSIIIFMVGVNWLTFIKEQKSLLKLEKELEQYEYFLNKHLEI